MVFLFCDPITLGELTLFTKSNYDFAYKYTIYPMRFWNEKRRAMARRWSRYVKRNYSLIRGC